MLLGEEGGHGGEAEDEVVAGDAEEHQGAHGLAAGHEGAEDEEKSRLDGTHTSHIGQGIGEEEHQAGKQLHLPEAEAAGQAHEPDTAIIPGDIALIAIIIPASFGQPSYTSVRLPILFCGIPI